MVTFVFFSCQENENIIDSEDQNNSQVIEKEVLKFSDIIGDTLRYDVGEPVFDIVISNDTNLYWNSFNPKYGTEAHESITLLPISKHENMVSFVEKSGPGVCWYNDFESEITTVSVFVGKNLLTFSGTVKRKHKKKY